MIRVLLIDDHKLVRSGIRRLLDECNEIEVVAEGQCGEDALQLARELKPDVVLMDISMPGIGGLEATRKLLHFNPDVKVIALSVHRDEPFPARLLEAGAYGYVTKDCAAEEIIHAIRKVHAGERYIDAEVARALALARLSGNTKKNVLEELSQREMQVMLMVVQGKPIQEISDQLFISPKTVSTYRYRLFEKLGVSNDVELTRLAMRYGLIDEGRQ
jgi:two-component system invasion response regulator UvrY